MEFGLSEDQKLLSTSIGDMLRVASDLQAVRGAIADRKGRESTIWRSVAELGVPAMLVPERYGGLGLTMLDAALAAEQLGAHVTPAPFVGSCVMAPIALAQAGSETQQAQWLPAIAEGKAVIGVGITESVTGVRNHAGLSVTDGRLSGAAGFAIDCEGADAFIVADDVGALHLVLAGSAGLSVEPVTTVDRTRGIAHLKFDRVVAEPMSTAPRGATIAVMIQAGRTILAADTLGAACTMIYQAVAFSLERKQFERIVGSFQAVKHMCAEMVAELEPCRALTWHAAHCFDTLPQEAAVMSAHAKSLVDEAGRFVARTATEVHGGMGFTDLLGLHFWFKRIGLNRQLLGGPEQVRTEIATLLGWGQSKKLYEAS
jgi:alkylation response protein AidB-like acyl-CoA dehydrogenase